MSQHIEEQQLTLTGTLINVTLFEDKIMRNFLIISNKLKKLEGMRDIQLKQKAIEKDFKFLTNKVETLVEKMPKDSGSLSRNDARTIAKQSFFDILNSNDEKLRSSRYNQDILKEINSVKESLSNVGKDQKPKKDAPRTSFTAGQVLRESDRQKDGNIKMPRQSLEGVLDERQMQMVNDIVDKRESTSSVSQLTARFDELTKIVEELRLGRGYASFLEKEAEKFERFEQYEEKSRQTARRHKDKPIQLQGIKAENVRGQILKSGLLNEVQRMELNKDEIARQQLMQRKTMYSHMPKEGKRDSKDPREFKDSKDGIKERDTFIGSLREDKDKQFRRSHSIRKLDRLDKRLKVDDIKELNGVLRQIELRIESKVSHDIFMGFVKDTEEKIEAIRLTKDHNTDFNELKKNVYILESKLQSVVAYLQSISSEDDALLVKKQWTCVSCDKGLQKYQGKVGQHLNWDTVSSKKISPTKVGAFGQTGQLAAKIRNLMDGREGDQ